MGEVMKKIALLLLSLLPVSAIAEEPIIPKTLKCDYPTASTLEVYADKPIKQINAMKPETTKEKFGFIIDNINLAQSSARLIGNAGGDDLVTVPGVGIISFLQVTGSGNITTTSLFLDTVDESGHYFSVHSRHMSWFGNGVITSQFYGTCKEPTPF